MESKPFKMKNPSLAKAMKEGTPMQLNYGSPVKDNDLVEKAKKYGKEYLKRLVDPTGLVEKGYNVIKEKTKKKVSLDKGDKKPTKKMHDAPKKYDDKDFGKPTGNLTTLTTPNKMKKGTPGDAGPQGGKKPQRRNIHRGMMEAMHSSQASMIGPKKGKKAKGMNVSESMINAAINATKPRNK
jgi:hypothetical protein